MRVKQEKLTKIKKILLKKRNSDKKKKNMRSAPAENLDFPALWVRFAKKVTDMLMNRRKKSRKSAYFEAVCEALLRLKNCPEGGDVFAELCSAEGADRIEMENMLYECFGMSADELTRRLYG